MPAARPHVLLGRLVVSILSAVALVIGLVAIAVPDRAHFGPTNWDCLAHYESTHRSHHGQSSKIGHFGGLQFSLSTWRYYGGPSHSKNTHPHKATRKEQIHVAKRVAWRGWKDRRAQGGRNAWPNTWSRCL